MITRDEFLKAIDVINQYKKQLDGDAGLILAAKKTISPTTIIRYSGCSQRLAGCICSCLGRHFDSRNTTIQQAQTIPLSKFRDQRNVGEATLKEFITFIHSAGLEVIQ